MSAGLVDIDNPFAMRARKPRAERLAAEVRHLGLSAEAVVDKPVAWWESLAEDIELPGDPPSPVTIAMAIGMLSSPGLAGGLRLSPVRIRPTCRLCNTSIGVDQPTACHMGTDVHAGCQHDFEEGWDRDE